jgi:hypothetical protein
MFTLQADVGLILIAYALVILIAIWAYREFKKRGERDSLGWGIGILVLLIVFLPILSAIIDLSLGMSPHTLGEVYEIGLTVGLVILASSVLVILYFGKYANN